MSTNLDKFKADLKKLIELGDLLLLSLEYDCNPKEFKEGLGSDADTLVKALPNFEDSYQRWYSEAKVLIRQLLPDRLDDFVRHYEKPKTRKEITYENYKIEDCLQGLKVTRTGGFETKVLVDHSAGIPQLRQQIAILKSVEQRFDSSLFEIRQLVTADMFDSEIEAARELAKHKFHRAAGALAGVVLEKHLNQVCSQHAIKVAKKNPGIADLNELLKAAGVIDIPQWRFIQHLADVRNICDHDKSTEPTKDQIGDLLDGVRKITKTVF